MNDEWKNYSKNLAKAEVLTRGPLRRNLDGLNIVYNIELKEIKISYDFISRCLACNFFIITTSDPALDVLTATINDKTINNFDNDKVAECIVEDAKENNIITIKCKSEADITYELGCIIFKIVNDNWEETINKILDTWEKDS